MVEAGVPKPPKIAFSRHGKLKMVVLELVRAGAGQGQQQSSSTGSSRGSSRRRIYFTGADRECN